MKRIFLAFALSFLTLSFALESQAQSAISTPVPSPAATVKQKIGLAEVTVTYNRPSARGRVVFGKLVPFGEAWRTGANGSTLITTDAEMLIEGKVIPAGTYGIYTVPNNDAWEIIFNKNTKAGGNLAAYKDEEDVLRVKLPVKKLADKVESFTITFDNVSETSATLDFIWENTKVSLAVKQDVNAIVMKQIETFEKNPMRMVSNGYYQAASYLLGSEQKFDKALEYVNKAIELKYDTYWVLRTKALIQAKLKDYKGAIETAKKSAEKAKADGDNHYVSMNEESIAEWSKK